MTPEQLQNHFNKLDLPLPVRQEFFKIAQESPARKVGESAKDNIIVHHWSEKNQRVDVLESSTVERLRALELELDRDVLAYYPQVRCAGIIRPNKNNVTGGTVDFMVVRRTRICFEECKAHGALHSLISKSPDEWVVQDSGRVVRPPYQRWAIERSATHTVWAPPVRFVAYLSNLQLIYAMCMMQEAYGDGVREMVLRAIARKPRTIDELMQESPRVTPQLISCMLGAGDVHGAIRNVEIGDVDRFVVYSSREQAEHVSKQLDERVQESTTQVEDAFTSASITDIQRGRKRLAQVNELLSIGPPYPPYWRPLIGAVLDARSKGESDQAVCTTTYASSGNRGSKLPVGTDAVVNGCLGSHWDTGAVDDIGGLYEEIKERCEKSGLYVPSKKSIGQRIKKRDATKRILATGGLRAYHASRPASDPRNRSTQPQAKYLVLEIDSTKCDNRSNCGAIGDLLMQTPLLYSGIDGCTVEPMADAFVFGPARSDGVAILLRSYARRHGRLPHEIRIDRGSENKNKWVKAFCERYRIHLTIMPSGGSRFKGGIENMLGRVNSQVSHRLAGSTKPDQAGRAVDGRFKSYRTARLQFRTVRDEIRNTLYNDFSQQMNDMGETPELQSAMSEIHFPSAGFLCTIDEEFLFLTSIPVRARAFNPVKGIRACGQTFTSEELLSAIKKSEIEDVRRDPENPSLIRVQLRRGTVCAWSKATAKIAHSDDADRQFHSFYGSQVRDETRESKDEARRIRYWRLTAINHQDGVQDETSSQNLNGSPTEGADSQQRSTHQKIQVSYLDVEDIGDAS